MSNINPLCFNLKKVISVRRKTPYYKGKRYPPLQGEGRGGVMNLQGEYRRAAILGPEYAKRLYV
jgi:hypothetical protein